MTDLVEQVIDAEIENRVNNVTNVQVDMDGGRASLRINGVRYAVQSELCFFLVDESTPYWALYVLVANELDPTVGIRFYGETLDKLVDNINKLDEYVICKPTWILA